MHPTIATSVLAIIGYFTITNIIPQASPFFINRGLFGKDMSKRGKPIIPESIGIIPAITYLFIMFLSIPFFFIKSSTGGKFNNLISLNNNNNGTDTWLSSLPSYLSSMLSLESMILLGLIDDLFDIRWRHKFFLPAIASIPLIIIYYLEFNKTSILIPNFISNYLQLNSNSIDLGIFYYIYMFSISIFCPNSINILAGINGIEVGQTIIIAILLILNDLYYILGHHLLSGNSLLLQSAYEIHIFSLSLLIPFISISIALFNFNKYPSKVFVGDTWCYFSGMVFAVLGISGHYAKTLMLFFIPQIINFIYSSPQLFGLIPCPRHRLPKFNEIDGLMYNSFTEYFNNEIDDINNEKKKPILKSYLKPILSLLSKLKLIKLEYNKRGDIIKSSNLTLINLVIIWFGPHNEGELCSLIMKLQFFVGFTMLVLRHSIAPIIFGFDNSWSMLNRFYI